VTKNYQQPMVDDLLWVYEGLTRYVGDVILRARSGLRTEQEIREYMSWVAAWMDVDRPGRAWRSIGDTARALPAYTDAPSAWMPERRYRDYYEEMLLVWLEADTIIRQKTNGARTLDDFCRAFFGGEKSAPAVRVYTLPDVISGLNAVAAYDWEHFFRGRVETVAPHAPLEGLQNAGWKLAYDDTPNVYQVAREITSGPTDLSFSIGLWVASDGVITDVVHGSPAFEASIAPSMRVKSVSGMPWSADDARSAIVGAKDAGPAIELVVEYADVVRTIRLDYHGGLRYPHLVRDSAKPDLLTTILTPREAVIH